MATFNHGKWIKDYKISIFEKAEKEKKEHLKDLLHTTKVDGKKADKVDIKLGAENDLAIERDKDGREVYATGLTEADQVMMPAFEPVKPFQPGDTWSNNFDYVGMLTYGASLNIPADLTDDLQIETEFLELLNLLFESFQDVNYHTEGGDLGNAIDWIEDSKGIEDIERAVDFLERFKAACQKTLKDITRR